METKVVRSTSLMDVLKQLLTHTNLTANALAKILHLPTPTIHRLLTGEVQDPRISTLTLVADYFGVTIEQLLGRKNLDHQFYAKNSKQFTKSAFSIPLFTLHEASALQQYLKVSAHDEKIFSMAIKNNLYEPLFTHGTVIIIGVKVNPENGDYVLVNFIGDAAPVLKRYISEGKNKYLATVTSDVKTIKFDSRESKIIGVVIEAYKSFKV